MAEFCVFSYCYGYLIGLEEYLLRILIYCVKLLFFSFSSESFRVKLHLDVDLAI